MLFLKIFQQMFEICDFKDSYLLSILKLLNCNVYYISIVTFPGKNLIYIFYPHTKDTKTLLSAPVIRSNLTTIGKITYDGDIILKKLYI